MTRIYYRGARAAIVCYDLTDPEAWEKVRFWVDELQRFQEGCRVYLCATKSDLISKENGYGSRKRRAVDFHEAEEYAEEVGAAALVETSAKTGENVDELFLKVWLFRVTLAFLAIELSKQLLLVGYSVRLSLQFFKPCRMREQVTDFKIEH